MTLVELLSDAFENARVDARRLEDPAVPGAFRLLALLVLKYLLKYLL